MKGKNPVSIPKKYQEILFSIGTYAEKLGTKAWIVGGAVRDFYFGRDTLDIDLSFEGNVDPLAGFAVKRWGGSKHKFSQFSTFRVNLTTGLKLDMVRARRESYPRAGVLPEVTPSCIKDDLFRRDFTANSWALSIMPGSFGVSFDPFGAQKDIDAGIIRILHPKSFLDDPTRMCRAVRFAGRFGWKLAPKTEELLKEAVKQQYPLLLSRERLTREFLKINKEKEIKRILEMMRAYGMLQFVYPGLEWHDGLNRVKTVDERLGVMVCSLGKSGEEFLKSMRVKKELAQEISEAWKVSESCHAPLRALTPMQQAVIRAVHPGLKKYALEPCFLRGRDLKELGLAGRRISCALERCRRMQWDGKVSSREDALKIVQVCFGSPNCMGDVPSA